MIFCHGPKEQCDVAVRQNNLDGSRTWAPSQFLVKAERFRHDTFGNRMVLARGYRAGLSSARKKDHSKHTIKTLQFKAVGNLVRMHSEKGKRVRKMDTVLGVAAKYLRKAVDPVKPHIATSEGR